MSSITDATAKAAIGGSGAVTGAGMMTPSEYVSFFDRIYDLGVVVISGDDISRIVGVLVGVAVASNIIYNVVKDVRKRADLEAE